MVIKDKKDKRPLWKEVYEDLFSQIDQYKTGERFYTLADIVREYGVSQNTAIKVLSELQSEGFIRKIKRKGTVVANNKKGISIKLLVPSQTSVEQWLSHFIGMKMFPALKEAARQTGSEIEPVSEDHLALIQPSMGDNTGMIVFQSLSKQTEEFLRTHSIPFVMLHATGPVNPSIPDARTDMKRGAYMAVRHLISSGRRRIAFLGGPLTYSFILPRFQGYLKALKEAGIKFDWDLVKEAGSPPIEEAASVKELLSIDRPADAIFAVNDRRALNILDYCKKNKIRIPEDLSIVGYDNIPETAMVKPALTTIDPHIDHLCVQVITMMLKLMDGENVSNYRAAPEIIIRESSASAN